MIISIVAEKAFGKIQYTFMIKKNTQTTQTINGNIQNIIKDHKRNLWLIS